MQCQRKKQDGNRCGARALTGKKYCPLHSDPGKAAELGSKGGRRRTIFSPENLKELEPPTTVGDLRDLLAQSIVDVRAGKLDPKLANSISYLGTGFLRAIEVGDLQEKLYRDVKDTFELFTEQELADYYRTGELPERILAKSPKGA
jgi:hypothetical protein